MYKHMKVAVTGGPCAGKTTAMQKIVEEFTEKGYKVFVVSETATELINGGAKPFGDNPIDILEFQRYVLEMQLNKEKLFEKIAENTQQDTIILCDRGIMDNRAYINNKQFRQLLKEFELNEMEIMSSYDLVLHLVTAADGAEEYYTTANNTARTETPEQARALDKKTLNSWIGHENLSIITNNGNFDDKLHSVIRAIYETFDVPYPIQTQYKYIVEEVDREKLAECLPVKLELEQFFTNGNDNENTMVRKTTKDGDSTYSSTTKRETDKPSERITTSRRITKRDYNELLSQTEDKPIHKVRYCFTHNKQYYRLDLFVEPKGLMILETGLTNENSIVEIPSFIKIKKEITEDLEYRNANIYRRINKKAVDAPLVKQKIQN